MYRLSIVLTLVLAALSAAAADTDREASQVSMSSIVVMREMVPVHDLSRYRAFHLAVTRSQAEQQRMPWHPDNDIKELEHFGLSHVGIADGQTTYEEVLARWTPLALDGDPEALSNLGVMYDLGLGVEPDQARAVRLYRTAAERGFVPAWNNLGIAYALGRGVARDDMQAVAWLRRAAEHGFALAQNTLGIMYLDGRWIAHDEEAGIKWMTAASEKGFEAARRNHELFLGHQGLRYAKGRGVPKDPVGAYKWFYHAAQEGHPDAAQRMAALTEVVERAIMERWDTLYFSVHEDELEKEKELVGKIRRGLCRNFSENNFAQAEKILKNSSIRFLGKELTLDRAYRHLRCSVFNASSVDLFRLPVANPSRAELTGKNLAYYFAIQLELGPFLMGNILMCRMAIGPDCMNVFEYIERRREQVTGTVLAEVLNGFESILRNNSIIMTHSGEFCRAYFGDTGGCQ